MKKFTFPKRSRLTKNEDFKRVIDRRCRSKDSLLTLYIAPNSLDFARLGVSISKTAGPAVGRNRFKRIVREVFRQSCEQIPSGYDYVVLGVGSIAKKAQDKGNLAFEPIKRSFMDLVNNALRKLEN